MRPSPAPRRLLLLALVLVLAGCRSLPPAVPVDPALGGTWIYAGGSPADDPLLDWSAWPDRRLTIDAGRGLWSVEAPAGVRPILPPEAAVTAVSGNLLTLVPVSRKGEPFQIYYRIDGDRLEFWWGDHADWLKPRVVYQRK